MSCMLLQLIACWMFQCDVKDRDDSDTSTGDGSQSLLSQQPSSALSPVEEEKTPPIDTSVWFEQSMFHQLLWTHVSWTDIQQTSVWNCMPTKLTKTKTQPVEQKRYQRLGQILHHKIFLSLNSVANIFIFCWCHVRNKPFSFDKNRYFVYACLLTNGCLVYDPACVMCFAVNMWSYTIKFHGSLRHGLKISSSGVQLSSLKDFRLNVWNLHTYMVICQIQP